MTLRTPLPLVLGVLLLQGSAPRAETPTTLRLWPGASPGEQAPVPAEEARTNDVGKVTSLTNVSQPTLTVYPATAAKATGIGIVVAPGGGYRNLAWDHEGDQIGRWFSKEGIAAFVLKYRVPRRGAFRKSR